MSKLLEGQQKSGSSPNDLGTQSGSGSQPMPTEAGIVSQSEKFTEGAGGQGFQPAGTSPVGKV